MTLAAVPEPRVPNDKLRALIQTRLDELDWSLREAARHTQLASYETFSAIMRGKGNRPSDRTLAAIAEALKVPESRVFEAAGLSTPEPWILDRRFWRIKPAMRTKVEDLLASILEATEPTERSR